MEVALASDPGDAARDPPKALKAAIDDFRCILTDEQRSKLSQIGAVRDAETVMIFTAQLDRENQLRKGRSVATRLISVLRSVQAFSTVVDTFVQSNPRIPALVWGSVKLTMLVAINYTTYFEALSGLFMSFSNHCPRFTQYQALYPASTRLQKALCDFHASIIRCCKHVVEATHRTWQKHLANAFLHSFHDEFRPYANEIQYLAKEVMHEVKLAQAHVDLQDRSLEETERLAASRQRSRLRMFIPRVENQLDAIKESQLRQSARRTREERLRLLECLSSHDYITPFREASKKRQCNTAEWIFETPEFKRWYDKTGPPLLWCSGKIGSGKTVLCANVINYVFAKKGDAVRIAFFFLEYDDLNSLRAETVIRSIIRQIMDRTVIPEHLEARLKALTQMPYVELQSWLDLAQQTIECFRVVYVFIDGLDEPDTAERRALLDALSSLTSTCPGLRIFASSRDSVHVDLKRIFSSMEHVSMGAYNLASDIRLYVETAVQERVRDEDLVTDDPGLLDTVKETLTKHADGMFLWVAFLIREICTASCDDDVRRILRTLPKDLEDTFSRALSRIISGQKMAKLTQKVFRWVAVAKRPLSLDEMREAVSIDIGQQYSKPERLVREMSRLALWSENLLQVTEEGTLSVRFAHSTIRDFMVEATLPSPLSGFHIDIEEADQFSGEICVTYLHFNDFKTTMTKRPQPLRVNPGAIADSVLSHTSDTGLTARLTNVILGHEKAKTKQDLAPALAKYRGVGTEKGLESIHQSHPFLDYAASHWISHTVQFEEGTARTWHLWQQLLTEGHSLAHKPWQSSASGAQRAMLTWSHQTHHYALLRYSVRVSTISEEDKDEELWISAYRGDTEVVAIFLSARSCTRTGLGNALQAASIGGHLEVVEQLLAAGADINAPPALDGWTALQAASKGGYTHVIERLLIAGADVNAPAADKGGRTALQAASEGGRLSAIERLLTAGADVNAAASQFKGRTALQAASEGGRLEVIELLLAAGADVNAATIGGGGRTALQAASESGQLQAVERLLAAGAKVNAAAAIAGGGRTALQAASAGGHLQVVERLLAAGADVNAAAAYGGGRTALQAASEDGHIHVIEKLLASGANVNAAAAQQGGLTALQAAIRGGHRQVIERLDRARLDRSSTN